MILVILLDPPSTSLPNHNTKCLVRIPPPGRQARKTRRGHLRPAYQITTRSAWLGGVSSWVYMKRAADFQSGIKSDRLKGCNTATNLNEHMLADRQQ
jgi:hypothetical protein